MSKKEVGVFLFCIPAVIVGVGVIVAKAAGLPLGFEMSLTAALVYVTAVYAFLTGKILAVSSDQAKTVRDQQKNSAAPVVRLSCAESPGTSGTEMNVGWMNIGKGPALNFRCWIEDEEHPELRMVNRAICRTAVEVAFSDVMSPALIQTGISNYRLGAGCIRAQYESVFGVTYESSLSFPKDAASELRYREVMNEDIVKLPLAGH